MTRSARDASRYDYAGCASSLNIRAEDEHHRRDKQLASSDAQYAAYKSNNDAKREARAKQKSRLIALTKRAP